MIEPIGKENIMLGWSIVEPIRSVIYTREHRCLFRLYGYAIQCNNTPNNKVISIVTDYDRTNPFIVARWRVKISEKYIKQMKRNARERKFKESTQHNN